MRRIADAATRAGVVAYALDTRGLIGLPTALRAESLDVTSPATSGSAEIMARRSEEGMRAAMNSIAVETGGFLVDNTNDLRAGLRTIAKDTDTYYLLAYEPTNTKRDGGFRRIEVRLPAVRGVTVRTRSGYFAADESRVLSTATSTDAARHDDRRRVELGAALGALAPLTGIPVRLAADFVSRDGAAAEIVVNGRVDIGALPFVRRGDRRLATVETVAVVLDEAGRVAATLETERRSLDTSDAELAQLVRQGGLPYSRAVAVKPGRYRVCLASRDDVSGLLGSACRRIEVPDLTEGRLSLSGLFLMKDGGSPSAGDAAPVLHSVQDHPRFGRAEGLYVQLFAYNPKRDASGAIDLVSQAAVVKGGAVVATAVPEPMLADAPGSPVGHLSRIRLHRLEAGEYELRITVTDRNAGATVARAVAFTVE